MKTSRITVASLLVLFGIAFFSVPDHALAQAWTRDQGNIYVQLSHRYIRASSLYGRNGSTNRIGSGDFVQHVVGAYGEVGVVDRWLTLSFEGELFRSNALKNQGRTTGLGDLRAGAWTGLLVAPFRLSAGVLVGIPTGDDSPSGQPSGVAASLPTGDGEVDVHFRLAGGHGFGGGSYPLLHYVLIEFGYALRTKGFNDQITYRGEFGTRIDRKGWNRMLLILRLTGTELLGGFSSALGSVANIGIGEFEVTAYGVEFAVRTVDTLHLSFGVDGAFRGASVPAAAQFKFGVSWEY